MNRRWPALVAGGVLLLHVGGAIYLVAPTGKGWTVLAGDRTAPADFSSPGGVAVDGQGNLYVADTSNHRIQKLSPTGQPLAQWGTKGSGPGRFDEPMGVAVDGQENVYVADTKNSRIQKLSSTGQPLAQWGTEGSGPGQFAGPSGVAVDGQGNLYPASLVLGTTRNPRLRVAPVLWTTPAAAGPPTGWGWPWSSCAGSISGTR